MHILHSDFTPDEHINRRSSLAISALLNEVSVDPMQHPLAPNTKQDQYIYQPTTTTTTATAVTAASDDYFNNINDSPISSGASSPSDVSGSSCSRYSFHQIEPPDLWNHSRTGTHQTHNGNIVISSLTKAKRKRILPHQYERLIQTFEISDTPSSEIRKQLAEELDMTRREVQVWFQNRRAKVNRSKSAPSTRQNSLSSLRSSSYSEDNRRRSEYTSSSSSTPYQPIKLHHSRSILDQPSLSPSKMILETSFRTSNSTSPKNSAIDLLASAAEMMRQN